jgi:UDP-N-acetylmuramoyl-L-alanyl-D-glutamate--2,6-diaminopimelate ligase
MKLQVPNINYKFITDNSKECDSETAFVVTEQNKKYQDSASESCCCAVELTEVNSLFGINNIKIIGVTGTNGKTTTTSLYYSMLLDLGYKVALQGTRGLYINDKKIESRNMTTPSILETYKNIYIANREECDFFIMEVSSHAIHQNRIESLNFALKVHTNITQDHLDYHGTLEEYIRVKNSFFADESLKLVNRDDEKIDFNYKNAYSYAIESGGTFKILAYSLTQGVSGIIQFTDEVSEFHSDLYGFFNLYNITSAIAGVKLLTQKPLIEVCETVNNFAGVEGRMEVISHKPLIIVDFAHTPDGMKQVLDSLREKDIILVFGAGGDRDKTKRPLMGAIAQKYASKVYLTSDNPRFEEPELIVEDILKGCPNKTKVEVNLNRAEAIKKAVLEIQKHADNDEKVLLVLGKGDEEHQVIYDKKLPFDDRKIIREILSLE